MAALLNNVATTDKVSDNEIQSPNAVGLSILIANAAVIANFKREPKGSSNESSWSEDLLLAPQTAQYRKVSGFRCRSAVTGVPARVIAVLSEPSDPQALGAQPYTAVLDASGGVTPGVNAVEVDSNGAVIGTEPKLDFEDSGTLLWSIIDDAANQRVKVTLAQLAIPLLAGYPNDIAQVLRGNATWAKGISRLAAGFPSGATLTFSSIPQTFAHLLILWQAGFNGAAEQQMNINFNGDVGVNYAWTSMESQAGVSNPTVNGAAPSLNGGIVGNSGSLTNGAIFIPNYTGVATGKGLVAIYGGVAVNNRAGVNSGRWAVNAALTSIGLSAATGAFVGGSNFYLYGIG